MANLSREYCAYFGEATEVWKRYVIGEIIVAFDEYRDSVCQTLQDADNSGPNASTGGGQDVNNQEEMFAGVLENAQQQAEQRIVCALNQTLNQPPPPPVSLSPVVSNIENQAARVNPPGENAISQSGFNSGQNDDDASLDVSIKSEVDSSSESECESDTDDDEVQVKDEPNEGEEDITGRSEEQTENANNNSNYDHDNNDSQNDNSNEAANEQESNGQAMMIDGEEDPNGPIIVVVQYTSPPSSPLNAEQIINSSQFNSRLNPDNQIMMNEGISSDDEIGHVDAEGNGDGDLEDDEQVDNMEIEENRLYDRQESDNEGSTIDEEENDDNDEEEGNEEEDEDYLMNDEESTDDTTDDDDVEQEKAAGPSTSTGRRSTRQVSKRQTLPDRQSRRSIKGKSEPLRIITLKLKCTVPGCKKVVKNKKSMNDHLLTAHKLKKYRCLVRRCHGKVSISFSTQAQLSDHIDQVHGRTSRLACHCSKTFKSYKKLNTHYWLYHQLGLFACSKDGCTFKPTRTRAKVANHQYTHLDAKYDCPFDGCDKSFKQKGHLDTHTLTHTGERPFICPDCDKSFPQKSHLTVHLRAHRNDQCYKCTWPQCTHSATIRGNVLAHIRTVHFELPRSKTQQAEEGIEDDRDPRDYLAKD